MKRNIIKVLVCLLLVATMVAAPMSAMAKTVQIMKINVDGARLRSGPGASAIITSLKKGTKVFYAGKQIHAFCSVRTLGGKTGYVYKPFLSADGAVESKQVYYTTGKCGLYKKPSTGSSRKATLSKHTYVVVFEVRGNWAYVKTTSGKGGFVKFSNLAKA